MYANFGQKSAYVYDFCPKTRVYREGSGKKQDKGKPIKGVSMDKQDITCDTETERNREQINNIKPIVPPTPKKNKEHPQRSRQFCDGEKFLWLGVPQQTA